MKKFWCRLLGLWMLLSAFSVIACDRRADEVRLLYGISIEASLNTNAQSYVIELRPLEVIVIEVDQHGLDVIVHLHDPHDREVSRVDSPNGAHGLEKLWYQAREGGRHILVIDSQAPRPVGAHFRVRIEQISVGTTSELNSLRLAACRERTAALAAPAAEAARAFDQAAKHWLDAGETELAILSLVDLAIRLDRLNQGQRGLQDLERALALSQSKNIENAPQLQMLVLRQLGRHYRLANEPQTAWRLQKQALELALRYHDRPVQASCFNNLALLASERQDPRRALRLYHRALELFRQLGYTHSVATVLHNMGQAYGHLGKLDLAIESLEEACRLGHQFGDPERLASSQFQLAWVYHLANQDDRALELFRDLQDFYERLENSRYRAAVLDRLGTVLQSMGHLRGLQESSSPKSARKR